jgi:hypothetical protein
MLAWLRWSAGACVRVRAGAGAAFLAQHPRPRANGTATHITHTPEPSHSPFTTYTLNMSARTDMRSTRHYAAGVNVPKGSRCPGPSPDPYTWKHVLFATSRLCVRWMVKHRQ